MSRASRPSASAQPQTLSELRVWIGSLALGPDVLFGLTIAILLGTFIGTYSSIYISAPALVWMGLKPDSFLRHEAEEDKTVAPAR